MDLSYGRKKWSDFRVWKLRHIGNKCKWWNWDGWGKDYELLKQQKYDNISKMEVANNWKTEKWIGATITWRNCITWLVISIFECCKLYVQLEIDCHNKLVCLFVLILVNCVILHSTKPTNESSFFHVFTWFYRNVIIVWCSI